jgi:hypothetical protein
MHIEMKIGRVRKVQFVAWPSKPTDAILTVGAGTVATLAPAKNQRTIAEIPQRDPRAKVQEANVASQIEDVLKKSVIPSKRQFNMRKKPMVPQPHRPHPQQDVKNMVIMMTPPITEVHVLKTRAALYFVSTIIFSGYT